MKKFDLNLQNVIKSRYISYFLLVYYDNIILINRLCIHFAFCQFFLKFLKKYNNIECIRILR